VAEFNKLKAVPMAPNEITDWARTIERVVPGLDPLMLCWLVDEMLAGRYKYDRNAGIQNLTIPLLSEVERFGKTYRFKTDFPG
jgi:hypothetical protein